MDKITYALFLNTLEFKVGDFVVHKDCFDARPFSPYMIREIDSFIEIHHHVQDWGNDNIGPNCVYMKQPWRDTPYYKPQPFISHTSYKKVPYDRLPKEVQEYADSRTQQVQPSDTPSQEG